MEFIESHPDLPWNWDLITENPAFTIEIIDKYESKTWNYRFLSYNPNVTVEIARSRPYLYLVCKFLRDDT